MLIFYFTKKSKEKLSRSTSSSLPVAKATKVEEEDCKQKFSEQFQENAEVDGVSVKRRFSLDFLGLRRGSKAKFDLLKGKRDSTASISSQDSQGSKDSTLANNQRRRSSTRMEGTSDLAAWCVG